MLEPKVKRMVGEFLRPSLLPLLRRVSFSSADFSDETLFSSSVPPSTASLSLSLRNLHEGIQDRRPSDHQCQDPRVRRELLHADLPREHAEVFAESGTGGSSLSIFSYRLPFLLSHKTDVRFILLLVASSLPRSESSTLTRPTPSPSSFFSTPPIVSWFTSSRSLGWKPEFTGCCIELGSTNGSRFSRRSAHLLLSSVSLDLT